MQLLTGYLNWKIQVHLAEIFLFFFFFCNKNTESEESHI